MFNVIRKRDIAISIQVFKIAIISLFFWVGGCTVRRFPVVRPVVESSHNVYAAWKAQEHFILARKYEHRGLEKRAEREYEKALQYDPDSKILKELVIRKYIKSRKFTQALLLIKQGRKNEELDRDEKRLVSTIYLKMGGIPEIKKAAAILESIKKKSIEELYSLGLIYESIGEITNSLKYYSSYFNNNPKSLQVGFKIVKMLLHEEKYDQADSLLTQIQKENGVQADIYNMRGTVAFYSGDTATGLQYLDSALVLDSLHEESLRNKAQIYIGRSDFSPAIKCYTKLSSTSTFGEVYNRTLALLYYYNKQFIESEKLLKQLLQTSMDDYELHYFLGLVCISLEKDDIAQIEFEKSLALHQANNDAWRELCSIFIRNNNLKEAYRIVKRYTQALPEETAAWRLRGYIETLRKEYKNAIDSYKKSISYDSLDTYTWFELGSAYERNKDIDKAVKAFRKVLLLHPNDPATLNYLGYMWAEKGENLDTAKAFLERALEIDPHNGAFLDSYAWVFYQLGNYDSAFIYLQKALDRISSDPVIYDHLGDILFMQNNYDSAIIAYQKALELNAENEDSIRQKLVDLEILYQREQQRPQ